MIDKNAIYINTIQSLIQTFTLKLHTWKLKRDLKKKKQTKKKRDFC